MTRATRLQSTHISGEGSAHIACVNDSKRGAALVESVQSHEVMRCNPGKECIAGEYARD